MRRVSLGVLVLIVALGILGGTLLSCRTQLATTPEPEVVGGPNLDRDEIAPGTAPPPKATLTLAGAPFKVRVKPERHGTLFRLVMVAEQGGDTIETEEYEDSFEAFRLLQAGGEHYEPPINLLKFPMKVGMKWDWKGQIVAHGNPKTAEAAVETAADKPIVDGSPVTAIRVTVVLKFIPVKGDDDEAAKRELTFWFAKDKGLFRRQYDWVSVREPAR